MTKFEEVQKQQASDAQQAHAAHEQAMEQTQAQSHRAAQLSGAQPTNFKNAFNACIEAKNYKTKV